MSLNVEWLVFRSESSQFFLTGSCVSIIRGYGPDLWTGTSLDFRILCFRLIQDLNFLLRKSKFPQISRRFVRQCLIYGSKGSPISYRILFRKFCYVRFVLHVNYVSVNFRGRRGVLEPYECLPYQIFYYFTKLQCKFYREK